MWVHMQAMEFSMEAKWMKRNLKYPYLEGKIAERNVSKAEIAKQLNITQRAFSNKLSGKSEFTWNEVLTMQTHFFHDVDMTLLMRPINNVQNDYGRTE